MKVYYVYILANVHNTVFYIGITNSLARRYFEHQFEINPNSFTTKYKLSKLIYFEEYPDPTSAIAREKQLKNWHRQWKINLIRKVNPNFDSLYQQ